MRIPLCLFAALLGCWAAPGRAAAADGFFDSGGVKIRYATEGAGDAVVLIHGWMADSGMWGRDWWGETKLDAAGAPGFRLIALDCRGHGKSDKPHTPEPYDAQVAEDVVRLLDHLKIDKAHLIGYSSGAFVAGKVAATHPERVRSVVYAGQAPLIGHFEPEYFTEVETFAKIVDAGGDLGDYLMAVNPPHGPKMTREQASALAKVLYRRQDVKAYAAAGRGFRHLAVAEADLKRCAAPVLFVRGEKESEYVKGQIATARRVLGRGDEKVIAGGDHITTLGKPAFGAALMEFLRAANGR